MRTPEPLLTSVDRHMSGAVDGSVRHLLRLEGVAVLLLMPWLYSRADAPWITFALLFLVRISALRRT